MSWLFFFLFFSFSPCYYNILLMLPHAFCSSLQASFGSTASASSGGGALQQSAGLLSLWAVQGLSGSFREVLPAVSKSNLIGTWQLSLMEKVCLVCLFHSRWIYVCVQLIPHTILQWAPVISYLKKSDVGVKALYYDRNMFFLSPRPGVFTAEPWEIE